MGLIPVVGATIETYGVGAGSVELGKPPRRSIDPGTIPIARVQACLGVGAALVGLVGVLLPHPAEFDETGLLITQAVSFLCGIVLLAGAGRIPVWTLHLMPVVATVLTTLSIIFTGDATSAYAMFYLWVGLYAFYFLSRTEAAIQIGFAIASYAAAVAIVSGPEATPKNSELHHLVVLTGTLVVGGVLLLYLRRRVEELMGHLGDASRTDLLTELPNARAMHDALTRELERARSAGCSLSVLVLDVDRFAYVNERLGHSTADDLLRRLGTSLVEATRPIDTVSRTGPAEFTLMLPESNAEDAYLTAEQLLARIRRGFREEFMPLTASAGIASYPSQAVTEGQLVKLAEDALAAAKILGRDRAVVSSPDVANVLSGTLGRQSGEVQSHLATMVSLAEALDLRDSGTAEHSQRVGEYAAVMARELGLSEQRTERVRLAGILHDIGKCGVPDSILCKAGPLNEGEWEEMRRHPEIGARILGSRELVDIREWVLASHERPDGKGYPRGLKEEEIPIEARILAVADAFEAMRGDRIYRPGISEEAARDELRACAGRQFDPEVVAAFLRARDREMQTSDAS